MSRAPRKSKASKATPQKQSIHAYLEGKAKLRTKRLSKGRKEARARFDRFESEGAEKAWKYAPRVGVDRLETRIQLISSEPTQTLRWAGEKGSKPSKKPAWKPGKKAPKGWKVVSVVGQRVKAPAGWTPDQPDPKGTRRIAIKQARSVAGTFGVASPVRTTAALKVKVRAEGERTWKDLDKADRRKPLIVALFDEQGKIVSPLVREWTKFQGEEAERRLQAFRKAEKVALLPKRVASIKMKGATVEDALRRLKFPELRYGQQAEFHYRVHFWTADPQTGNRVDHVVTGSIYEDWRRSFIDPSKKDKNLTSREKSMAYSQVVQRQLAISIRSQLAHGAHPMRFTTMKRLEGGVAAYRAWLREQSLPEPAILKMTLGDKEGIPRKLQTRKQKKPLFQHLRAKEDVSGILITEAEFDRLAAYDQARDCHLMVWATIWDLPD